LSGLLRLSTAGSVDDGKSTLIGRLLYDSKGAYEDQLASISKDGEIDLSRLTDGLRAEREQGITIDVAYRYFSTPRRKFIIADTPGHEQYTRNMATGASTADLAVILIDARYGVLPQSRRHAYIATLLGIRKLVVAVNKMDLVGFDQGVFDGIQEDFLQFAGRIHAATPYFVPVSALNGDNVVSHSENTPWFTGPHLLEYLETVQIAAVRDEAPMRFPVQYVLRPNLDFRGYAGQVASGVLKPGDLVIALPAGRTSRIKRISTFDGDLDRAYAPMSVTVLLEDEIDISRGDMLAPALQAPHISRRIDATLVWMNHKELEQGRTYLLKHTAQTVRATINRVKYRVNINTLDHEPATTLVLNEIGAVALETHRPLFFDSYTDNRITGAFILIDPLTNETVAGGMITGRGDVPEEAREELEFRTDRVTPAERFARFGHAPAIVDVPDEDTAYEIERELFERGCLVQVLTGDAISQEAFGAVAAGGGIALCVKPGVPAVSVKDLEKRGVIRPLEDPFTGGAGI
jgi:sulfate adenylyltransferase large subunit